MKTNFSIEKKHIVKKYTEKEKENHPTTFLCYWKLYVAGRGCSVWFYGNPYLWILKIMIPLFSFFWGGGLGWIFPYSLIVYVWRTTGIPVSWTHAKVLAGKQNKTLISDTTFIRDSFISAEPTLAKFTLEMRKTIQHHKSKCQSMPFYKLIWIFHDQGLTCW